MMKLAVLLSILGYVYLAPLPELNHLLSAIEYSSKEESQPQQDETTFIPGLSPASHEGESSGKFGENGLKRDPVRRRGQSRSAGSFSPSSNSFRPNNWWWYS